VGTVTLLESIRIRRPDLRDEVGELISMVTGASAGQKIPLVELVRVLAINIAPAFAEQLASRGVLVLSADSFENRGPSVRRKVRLLGFGVNLDLAPRLAGRLVRFHDSFQLGFDPDHSVSMPRFLFQVELRHLDLSAERIFVDFAGAQDVFIDLS